jgi:D-tyrosyl-tRNA(Tyr) deacylase
MVRMAASGLAGGPGQVHGMMVRMRAVIQRVDGASVVVDDGDGGTRTVGEITGEGLCVLVGVTHEDTREKAAQLARKLWSIRMLRDEKSCSDVAAPLLVVSQFTLYGDARKGRRPTWNAAAPREVAEPLVDEVVAQLRALGATVATGRFAAHMRVSLSNDGPFTVLLDI